MPYLDNGFVQDLLIDCVIFLEFIAHWENAKPPQNKCNRLVSLKFGLKPGCKAFVSSTTFASDAIFQGAKA